MEHQGSELEREMLSRVRKHIVTSLAGVVVIALVFVGAVALTKATGATKAMRAAPVALLMLIPVIGLWSTFKNLRCPSCDGPVALQATSKLSIFGSLTARECRHCGKPIFGPLMQAGFRRMFVILAGTGIVLGCIAAILTAVTRHH